MNSKDLHQELPRLTSYPGLTEDLLRNFVGCFSWKDVAGLVSHSVFPITGPIIRFSEIVAFFMDRELSRIQAHNLAVFMGDAGYWKISKKYNSDFGIEFPTS